MHANTNTTTNRKNEVLGNAKITTEIATTVIEDNERSHYEEVLDKVKYGDDEPLAIENGEFLDALHWLGYSITKSFVRGRPYLPNRLQDACTRLRRVAKPVEVYSVAMPLSVGQKDHAKREMLVSNFFTSGEEEIDDWREDVVASLLTSLANDDRENAIDNAFKALNDTHTHGNYASRIRKTLPREEREWKPERAFVATLFTADLSTVGGNEKDLDVGNVCGDLSIEDRERLPRLVELFNSVKEAHKFATPEKWLCAQCYALNMPTEVAIERVYGEAIKVASAKSQKALDKAVNSCRVKYSRHANEVFGWVLDEVEKRLTIVDELTEALKNCETILEETQDTNVVNEVHERQAELRKSLCEAEKSCEGYGKWADVLNRCKATAEATVTLEECAVKFSLDDEVVKFLRSRLNALPHQVLRYCEAVRAGATA